VERLSSGRTAGVVVSMLFAVLAISVDPRSAQAVEPPRGVCPPFLLRDELGNVINPVTGENAGAPYSPKQTCGACHDYDLITQGYHFTQGMGEEPTPDQAARCQWASTPGNYGGTWCSPAPLYRYLSPKHNESADEMDMTSFSFLMAGCALCHPGGGSAEFDRDGKRYEQWMADPASGFTPGGDNNFDGDYYKARWTESGVLEADCMLCHLPAYDFKARKKQLDALNFRWAPSAGAGLAGVTGAVADGGPVAVAYDTSKFNPDGTLAPPIVREPRNENCLACHAKPGWKKRGANFSPRTDVHLRAGLKCVDCHPAGSKAVDDRIRGKEIHHIGKGDDPGGHVRDDLNNTMRDCADCHSTGYLGAPIAKHRGLPPLHLDKIACQTCHIPERAVKAAHTVASDVFNPGARIPTPGRHLWTFYGPDSAYWNHYGDLEMMGYADKPTDPYRPVLVRYNGKIYPVNRIHNAWPAIATDGEDGLMQPRMGDVYKMWTAHHEDPSAYPTLAELTDDNGDGVIEVNRPEEIDALIAAITAMLEENGYPMDGKRVVWVMNDRVYTSGAEYRTVPMHAWEASPYANVHKYSHDVYPAAAALGRNGCTDCHSTESDFFFARVVLYPFDHQARPVTTPQHVMLGLNGAAVRLGAWREAVLKEWSPWLLFALLLGFLMHYMTFGPKRVPQNGADLELPRFTLRERAVHLLIMLSFCFLLLTGLAFLAGVHAPLGSSSRYLHTLAGFVFGAATLVMALHWSGPARFRAYDRHWMAKAGGYFSSSHTAVPAGKFNAGQKLYFWTAVLLVGGLVGTGTIMTIGGDGLRPWMAMAYTLHDVLALVFIVLVATHVYLAIWANPGSFRGVMTGKVSSRWAARHHPEWLSELEQQRALKP
jgi:formate dehydrogenase gamma subunit